MFRAAASSTAGRHVPVHPAKQPLVAVKQHLDTKGMDTGGNTTTAAARQLPANVLAVLEAEATAAGGYHLLDDDALPTRTTSSDDTSDGAEVQAAHQPGGSASDNDAMPYNTLAAGSPRLLHVVHGATAGLSSGSAASSADADDAEDACSHASSESSDDVVGGLLYDKAELSLRVAELEAMHDTWEAKVTQLTADNAALKAAAALAAQSVQQPAGLAVQEQASSRMQQLLRENDQLESRLTEMTAEMAAVRCHNKMLRAQLSGGARPAAAAAGDSECVRLLGGDQPNSLDSADVLESLAPLVQQQQQQDLSSGWDASAAGTGLAVGAAASAAGTATDPLMLDLQALASQQAEVIEALQQDNSRLREQSDKWDSRVTTYAGENAVLAIKVKALEASLAKHRQLLAASAAASQSGRQHTAPVDLVAGLEGKQQLLHPQGTPTSVQQRVLQGSMLEPQAGLMPVKQQLPATEAKATGAATLQMMWSGQLQADADDASEGDWEIQAAMLNADIRSVSSSYGSVTSSGSTPASYSLPAGAAGCGAVQDGGAVLVQAKHEMAAAGQQLADGSVSELRQELQLFKDQCAGLSGSLHDIDQLVNESLARLSTAQRQVKLL